MNILKYTDMTCGCFCQIILTMSCRDTKMFHGHFTQLLNVKFLVSGEEGTSDISVLLSVER